MEYSLLAKDQSSCEQLYKFWMRLKRRKYLSMQPSTDTYYGPTFMERLVLFLSQCPYENK